MSNLADGNDTDCSLKEGGGTECEAGRPTPAAVYQLLQNSDDNELLFMHNNLVQGLHDGLLTYTEFKEHIVIYHEILKSPEKIKHFLERIETFRNKLRNNPQTSLVWGWARWSMLPPWVVKTPATPVDNPTPAALTIKVKVS